MFELFFYDTLKFLPKPILVFVVLSQDVPGWLIKDGVVSSVVGLSVMYNGTMAAPKVRITTRNA